MEAVQLEGQASAVGLNSDPGDNCVPEGLFQASAPFQVGSEIPTPLTGSEKSHHACGWSDPG